MTSLAPTDPHAADAGSDEPLLTENARKVLEARYLKKNEAGEVIEPASALFRRVAKTIAEVEALYGATDTERRHWADRFYTLMTSGAFMPNSPTLMNAGRELGMLSACFVLPVRDSINDIFDSIKHTALIQKAGGGTGFAFDELRPTGDYIQSSGGTTSGPISFWRAFSEATNAIQQGAFRRGANMGMMYVHHPDILKFLHAKQDLSQFTNYNISVKITDAWMDEYLADADSPQIVRNPRNGRAFALPRDLDIWKYDIRSLIDVSEFVAPVDPESRACYYTSPRLVKRAEFDAQFAGRAFYTKRDIWDIIVKNAHHTGEPGVVFIDRINDFNPTPQLGRMESTNPCGEQPLLPYEACNLGSINLGVFITNPLTPAASVDWETLRDAVHLSVRFLDNVIDANNYVLPEIDSICKGNRKIGLGIMGFADALYKLGVAYNSEDGVQWGERFMKFVNDESHRCSEHLARCRGCFPNWKGSTWQTRQNRMMRNACSTTVAPTGTISIIANCSGGIEPMFSLAFIRNVLRGQKQGEKPLVEVNDTFLEVARQRGFHSDALLERIAREGTLANIDEIPADVKQVFVCAHDITPDWHMKMQAAFQRHCDSSISKTINFAHDATPGEVEQIYRLAYELRCKGVTVYRDGCRDLQPMALKKEGTEALRHEGTKDEHAREREAPAEPLAASAAIAATPAEPPVAPAFPPHPALYMTPLAPPPAIQPPIPPNAPAPVQSKIQNPKSKITPEPSMLATRTIEPQDLPEIVSGLRIRQATPFGNMHVKITVDPRADRELEVFAQLGKGGDVATSDLEAICRMISLWLRGGGSLMHVIKQLEGIGSSLQIPTRSGRIMSLGDGLACALKKYMNAKQRFGLRALLLGEVDPAELDNPFPPPHHVQDHGGASLGGAYGVTHDDNGHRSKPRPDANGASEPQAPARGPRQSEPRAEASGQSDAPPSNDAPPRGNVRPPRPAGRPTVTQNRASARPVAMRPGIGRSAAPGTSDLAEASDPASDDSHSPLAVAVAVSPEELDARLSERVSPQACATDVAVPDAPSLGDHGPHTFAPPFAPAPALPPGLAPTADAPALDTAAANDGAFTGRVAFVEDGVLQADDASDHSVAQASPPVTPTMNYTNGNGNGHRPRAPRPAKALDARVSYTTTDPQAQACGAASSEPRVEDPPRRTAASGPSTPSEPQAPARGSSDNLTLADESDPDTEQAVAERYARLAALAEVMAEDDTAAAVVRRTHANGDSYILRNGHDSALHYKICCPQCDGHLTMQEGCRKCLGCGWSAC